MGIATGAEFPPLAERRGAFHPAKDLLPHVEPDMNSRRGKETLLRSTPLFADLPLHVLNRIADRSVWRDHRRRQAIHFPGDPADAVFVVRRGRVKISRLSEDGKEATLNLIGPHEPFGEECLLDAVAREALAEVLEPSQSLRIAREELLPVLGAHPPFALAVARLMSGRRRTAESRLEEMVFKTVRSRLAALLTRLAQSHGRVTSGGILLDLALAHQDLAGQIGSTRETTTLTLNQFRRGGLLRIHHCRILIRNLAGLEAIA
jgi:CRP/FNR family transcriptional regulator